MAKSAKVLEPEPPFPQVADERARYPTNWGELRARILTRMSDAATGTLMYTITRTDTGQSCKLLADGAFDALLRFHGRSFTSRYQCDTLDGRLRATHKDSGIEYVVSHVEAYFEADE